MSMDIAFVEQLIGILERSTLSEVEYAEDGGRVRLVRAGNHGAADTASTLATAVQDAPAGSYRVPRPDRAKGTKRIGAACGHVLLRPCAGPASVRGGR